MRKILLRAGLAAALSPLAWFALRSESAFPDFVLESVRLLQKPIEDLLPDLDEDPLDTQAIVSASLDLEPYLEMQGGRARWNEMRLLIESGQPLTRPLPSEIALSTAPIGGLAPEFPPDPGFTVRLPYESKLTVSGRKTIGMIYRSTRFTNSDFAQTQGVPSGNSNFELTQQLQVRINGQVGRKVTINVDFDDTKEDKRDISIVYKGDPDEIVQRAAFGDLTLSLPQTEFAGYNKQVFGASAELQYKALRGYFIGSRTKGETETKGFTGNVILQRQNISDTAYIRWRFYNYRALNGRSGDSAVPVNSVQVWIDNKDGGRCNPVTGNCGQHVKFAVDSSLIPNAGVSDISADDGLYREMTQGTEYTVDPSSGVITFRDPVPSNSVIAIDYALPDGRRLKDLGSGNVKMLKFDEALSANPPIPITEELTHYNVGAIKIVRDNNQGNFTLQLRNLNDDPIGESIGVRYLPNNQGEIQMDFENGVFVLSERLDADGRTQFNKVYQQSPTSESRFFVEYLSRVKSYTLRPNIVINSERILMNGRPLIRDQDYFIDYESGFITFYNEDQITESTRITATYDFSPFGIAGEQTDTLVGARTELSLAPVAPVLASSLIGTTVIYDFAPKQSAAPDIRQTSGSFLITEADATFKDLIFNPFPLLKSTFSGEVARSQRNPNTFGKALIDNMEGIKDDTSISLNKLSWQIAANPTAGDEGSTYLDAIGVVNTANNASDNLTNELVQTKQINQNASALESDQTLVLNIRYDLTRSREASIATTLSVAGLDFSKKLFVEFWIRGDGSVAPGTLGGPTGTRLNATLGQISENFDNSGALKTEDANRNNTLDVGEDSGILFQNPSGPPSSLGAGNLRIDSNDLDRDGSLDATENSGSGGHIGYAAGAVSDFNFAGTSTGDPNEVDFSGWQFVRVPLNISSNAVDASRWSAIKALRLSVRPRATTPDGFGATGLISIAKISIVGNRYESIPGDILGSTVSVKAVNNEDDRNYYSPTDGDFNALNQVNTALTGPLPDRRREQALGVAFTVPRNSTATARNTTTTSPMDFTPYGSLRFYVNKRPGTVSGNNTFLFFRVGSDTDYWEYLYPLNDLTQDAWVQLRINQPGESRAERWEAPSPAKVNRVGSPNLGSVAQTKFGIVNHDDATEASGEIWINELHASDVLTRIGYAQRMNADFELFGWGTWGLKLRNIDRNFETFTTPLSNQDSREEEAYLTLSRLKWFPMKFTGLRRRTITPSINTLGGSSSLVSVLEEGRVTQRNYTAEGNLQIPKWPVLGMNYQMGRLKTDDLFREDKTNIYGATLDYNLPIRKAWLPENFQMGYKITKLDLLFGPEALAGASDPFGVSDTKTDTRDLSARATFQPKSGFTFTPNYTLSTTTEEKDVIYSTTTVEGSTQTLKYDKARSQTAGLDGVLGFARWFSPRLGYAMTTRETYGIPLRSNLDAADLKTVDRESNSEATWDFAWRDFSRKLRPLQSLNMVTSYTLEDGDSWENVDAGFNSLSRLSVRQSLRNGDLRQQTLRNTLRNTARWSPFDWATNWTGARLPLRTLSLTSSYTNTEQKTETTGTETRIHTRVFPDIIMGLSQTEHFFRAERWMSNSQMNLKGQYKTVDTVDRTFQKTLMMGGDWRMTLVRKLDLFMTYTRTTDETEDKVNGVISNDSINENLGLQLGFNIGKWRLSPKYDQTKQQSKDATGRLSSDLRTRKPSIQAYADLYLPAGLKLPFSDVIVFSNRIRTTNTLTLEQRRSSLNSLRDNTDTYSFSTSNDYEITSLIRLTFGGSYGYTINKESSDANTYTFELNSLLTIQF